MKISEYNLIKLLEPCDITNIININLLNNLSREQIEWQISTDSREIQDNNLNNNINNIFLGLVGENFDGGAFFEGAINNNSKLLILSQNNWEKFQEKSRENSCLFENIKFIFLKNTLLAYQKLALYHRQNNLKNSKIIAITGSNGKTSAKEILKLILKNKYKLENKNYSDFVVCTEKNENNEIGVPKTILRASEKTEFLVLEMGMRGLGQIQELVNIALPDYSLITSIGLAHLELLGSPEAIAKAKAEIFNPETGSDISFLPENNKYLLEILENYKNKNNKKFIFFGKPETESIKQVIINNNLACNFKYKNINFKINSLSTGLIETACGVIELCLYLKFNLENIQEGLAEFSPTEGRGKIINLRNNIFLVDETYNSSPDSVKALVNSLELINNKNINIILILGEMAELGDSQTEKIQEILESLAKNINNLNINNNITLLLNGQNQEFLHKKLCEFNNNFNNNYKIFNSQSDIFSFLKNNILNNNKNNIKIIALKASRKVKLENLLNKIINY